MLVNGNVVTTHSYLCAIQLPTPAPAAGTQINFADIPTLRYGGVKIQGIQAFDVTALAVTPNQNGAVIAANAVTGITVTFEVFGYEQQIKDVPLYDFISYYNFGAIRAYNNMIVNLVKSYITITDATNLVAGTNVPFLFHFEQLTQAEKGQLGFK